LSGQANQTTSVLIEVPSVDLPDELLQSVSLKQFAEKTGP
jgi:hypothetical protein